MHQIVRQAANYRSNEQIALYEPAENASDIIADILYYFRVLFFFSSNQKCWVQHSRFETFIYLVLLNPSTPLNFKVYVIDNTSLSTILFRFLFI